MSRTNRKWKDAGVAVCVRMRRLTAPIAGVVVHPERKISFAVPRPSTQTKEHRGQIPSGTIRPSIVSPLVIKQRLSRGCRCATASAGRNTRWTRLYTIGTGNREFWMHLWRMFSKRNPKEKGGVADEPKDGRTYLGSEGHETQARDQVHGALTNIPIQPSGVAGSSAPRAALRQSSSPQNSSAGETSNTPHTALTKGGALGVPCRP